MFGWKRVAQTEEKTVDEGRGNFVQVPAMTRSIPLPRERTANVEAQDTVKNTPRLV